MAEKSDELKKLLAVATDLVLPAKIRTDSIKSIGDMATREAFLALLELVANEQLTKGERELAIKYAREMIRSGQ
jgi:hypothetical protein